MACNARAPPSVNCGGFFHWRSCVFVQPGMVFHVKMDSETKDQRCWLVAWCEHQFDIQQRECWRWFILDTRKGRCWLERVRRVGCHNLVLRALHVTTKRISNMFTAVLKTTSNKKGLVASFRNVWPHAVKQTLGNILTRNWTGMLFKICYIEAVWRHLLRLSSNQPAPATGTLKRQHQQKKGRISLKRTCSKKTWAPLNFKVRLVDALRPFISLSLCVEAKLRTSYCEPYCSMIYTPVKPYSLFLSPVRKQLDTVRIVNSECKTAVLGSKNVCMQRKPWQQASDARKMMLEQYGRELTSLINKIRYFSINYKSSPERDCQKHVSRRHTWLICTM